MNKLDFSKKILFFVDMLGGSPFNTANQVIKNKNKNLYDILLLALISLCYLLLYYLVMIIPFVRVNNNCSY
ncbi:hypothetical protein [Arsenophonus symbiont of Ornithomya chloropus]|uniref:PTS sugar transporter subunit IIA domain-containing protein n=1 Tax=Arsenophonus symbiont of Ornithomya chloropus TaxID=634121 RepID=UPI003D6D5771